MLGFVTGGLTAPVSLFFLAAALPLPVLTAVFARLPATVSWTFTGR
ncbi:hypothetical protein [Geodermatophilus sp. URMC 62]